MFIFLIITLCERNLFSKYYNYQVNFSQSHDNWCWFVSTLRNLAVQPKKPIKEVPGFKIKLRTAFHALIYSIKTLQSGALAWPKSNNFNQKRERQNMCDHIHIFFTINWSSFPKLLLIEKASRLINRLKTLFWFGSVRTVHDLFVFYIV